MFLTPGLYNFVARVRVDHTRDSRVSPLASRSGVSKPTILRSSVKLASLDQKLDNPDCSRVLKLLVYTDHSSIST